MATLAFFSYEIFFILWELFFFSLVRAYIQNKLPYLSSNKGRGKPPKYLWNFYLTEETQKMNKFLTLALPFTLSVALLASCSSTQEAPEADPGLDTSDTSLDQSGTFKGEAPPPDSYVPATPPEEGFDAPAVPPEEGADLDGGMALGPLDFQMGEGIHIDQTISDKLASAITGARDQELNDAVPILSTTDDDLAPFLFPQLGFDPDFAQGFAISASGMNVKAYCIAAILPVEGQEEAVIAGLEGFKATKIQEFTGYLADQLEVAESARIETLADGTILMVMSETMDADFDAIVENLFLIPR